MFALYNRNSRHAKTAKRNKFSCWPGLSLKLVLIQCFSLYTTCLVAAPKNIIVATIPLSTFAGYLAVSPNNQSLYIGENDVNAVEVVSTATNSIVATIPVGNLPISLAITPDGTMLYATNAQDGTVSAISTATNAVTATLTVGQYPKSVAVSPDGTYAYVANHNDGTLSIIDTTTNEVLTEEVVLEGAPDQVVFSTSGQTAYVSSTIYIDKRGWPRTVLSAIDTSADEIIFSHELQKWGISALLTVNPQVPRMYVVGSLINFFNTKTNQTGRTFPLPDEGLSFENAITPDGQYLYIPDGDAGVEMFEIKRKRLRKFQVGQYASSIAIAPNGNYAYVATSSTKGASQIVVVDISER
jgi:YVTN family beta-propeller protein